MNKLPARLLIANHIDPSLLRQPDQRTFTQRIFWLAREGDLILVASEPDAAFLEHVCDNLGIKQESFTIMCVTPPSDEGRVFDPRLLIDDDLIARLLPLTKECTEVLCLWPSVQVAELAMRLGLEHAFEGCAFFSQGGDAFANSKASFRALAAAAQVPIPKGTVCRAADELGDAISRLLEEVDGVMVKQAHNGAAAGCTVISRTLGTVPRTAGSIWIDDLSELEDSIPHLWHWASANDRFPVVVEELKIGFRTVWFEFESRDPGVILRSRGGLEYEKGKMVREHAPLMWDVDQDALDAAEEDALRLAEVYHAIGYRGHLSADGLVNDLGEYTFTEMNARIGGSLPIYGGIWERVVKQSNCVDRHIVQHLSPSYWTNLSTREVLERLEAANLLYDPVTRTGAALGIPPLHAIGQGSFQLILVTEDEEGQDDLFNRVAAVLCTEESRSVIGEAAPASPF